MSKPTPSRGFTLLELLFVLALMVLMLALVPPLLTGSVSGAQLKAAARELAAGLSQARSEAILRQRDAVLVLDVDRRSYQITGTARVFRLPEKLDFKLYTAQSELAGGSAGAIRFFPDGSSTGGRITVSAGERSFGVDVDWLTGRVRILD
jgi:general secretion pathway protein H